MAQSHAFHRVKLIFGVLSTQSESHGRLFAVIEEAFGPIEMVTEATPFTFTDYYDDEMGANPMRFFIVCRDLVDPAKPASYKLLSNRIEMEFSVEGKRKINLDPGILSAENLILATTKNRSHRIPLSEGIYAEVTLMYRNKEFQSFPWTYADYASERFKALFARLRSSYLEQLKH
jgi:hypothetical protein